METMNEGLNITPDPKKIDERINKIRKEIENTSKDSIGEEITGMFRHFSQGGESGKRYEQDSRRLAFDDIEKRKREASKSKK
ncbi:hypothetical protein A2997_02355 [Candidatus Nomurabacteria bacterium RIFCSPLOWO2_01_FULL_36_10b]|uniref:Uncharacterized protein n=1 Tax=Candidatus Nomurabacteria bacterium RIFCSPLOWO2_01_FULL_36_10b TaxID=1801766 RepID=A0A1F6WP94_9BACT|nr:MAG: hypothetical protein A2997_02355 [Candidatus Nomurabacteria bacterium RIFCSPLOWO2_01_FULL_36_10b]